MKKISLILLGVSLSIGQLKAQNAYYDAINLAKWESSKGSITLDRLDTLYAEMLSYSPNQKWDSITNNPILRGLYITLFKRYFINLNKNGIIGLVSNNHQNYEKLKEDHPMDSATLEAIQKAYKNYLTYTNKIREYQDSIDSLRESPVTINRLQKAFKDSLNKHRIDFKTLIYELLEFPNHIQLNTIYTIVKQKIMSGDSAAFKKVDSTRLVGNDTIEINNFANFLKTITWNDSDYLPLYTALFDNFESILKQESIKNSQDSIKGFKDCDSILLTKIINNLFKLNNPAILFNNHQLSNDFKKEEVKKFPFFYSALPGEISSKETQDASMQTSQSTTSLTNLSSISQTELIDAVAIFMVSRFKQEAALTFVDWLRKKMDQDGILKDLFPNTIQQLNNTQVYELPRFGAVWRHVLSEDFIDLPGNIAKSPYIIKKIDTAHHHKLLEGIRTMGDICEVAQYVYQQNALPDIVAFQHRGSFSLSSKSMKDAFKILNLIDVELYDSSVSKYWLNWNNLNNMNDQEWNIFYALIRMKYSTLFNDSTILKPKLKDLDFKKYLIKTLSILNIFENNQIEYQKQFEKNPDAQSSVPDFWAQQINIFASVLDPEIINLPSLSKADSFIQQTLNIYQEADQKNYAAMIHESFKMIDLLIPQKNDRLEDLLFKKWKINKSKFQSEMNSLNNQVDEFESLFDTARNLYKNDSAFKEIKKYYVRSNIGGINNIIDYKSLFDSVATFLVDSFYSKHIEGILAVRNRRKLGDSLYSWLKDPDPLFNLDNSLIKDSKIKFQALNNLMKNFDSFFDSARKLYQNDPDFQILKQYYDSANLGDKHNIIGYRSLFDSAATFFVSSFHSNHSKPAESILSVRNGKEFGDNLYSWLKDRDSSLLNYPEAQPSRFLDISKAAEFLTDLMTVKNSQDLSAVISSYSAPPNSYKIKRNSRMSIDLNGFIGTYGGTEFIFDSSGTPSNGKHEIFSGRMVYGFSAPIGITFSRGNSRQNLNGVSSPSDFLNRNGEMKSLTGNCWSVSVTVFDLAAVVAYRFEKGDNGALPKQVSWSQLFSPGLNISWGIKNTPLCLTAGVQYTPQLRNLQSDNPQKQAVRIYGGLFFDIPFFNIVHH